LEQKVTDARAIWSMGTFAVFATASATVIAERAFALLFWTLAIIASGYTLYVWKIVGKKRHARWLFLVPLFAMYFPIWKHKSVLAEPSPPKPSFSKPQPQVPDTVNVPRKSLTRKPKKQKKREEPKSKLTPAIQQTSHGDDSPNVVGTYIKKLTVVQPQGSQFDFRPLNSELSKKSIADIKQAITTHNIKDFKVGIGAHEGTRSKNQVIEELAQILRSGGAEVEVESGHSFVLGCGFRPIIINYLKADKQFAKTIIVALGPLLKTRYKGVEFKNPYPKTLYFTICDRPKFLPTGTVFF